VVIDPVAGSGTTILAAMDLGRSAYGFEIKKNFYNAASALINDKKIAMDEIRKYGFAKTEMGKFQPSLFENYI
jgi:site-specific DNA-methyltransferase (adenine-specific)